MKILLPFIILAIGCAIGVTIYLTIKNIFNKVLDAKVATERKKLRKIRVEELPTKDLMEELEDRENTYVVKMENK